MLLSEELRGSAQDVIAAVQGLEVEGIIAKKRDSRYVSGDRHHAWVKLKLDCQQEFVIGGYRPGPHGVDTLLVGVYDGTSLQFAGKVRAGFTPPVRRAVATVLAPLHTARCPFVDLPTRTALRLGPRGDCCADGRHALGAADHRGADRVRGMDRRCAFAPCGVRRTADGQSRTGDSSRIAGSLGYFCALSVAAEPFYLAGSPEASG